MLANRECGECHACCVYPSVPALNKPAGVRCEFLAERGNCSVYQSRPKPCRDYACAWITGYGKNSDRPDRINVLIDQKETQFGNVLVARALIPGSCQTRPAVKAMHRMSKSLNVVCLVVSDDIADNQRVQQIVGDKKVITRFKKSHPELKLLPNGKPQQRKLPVA